MKCLKAIIIPLIAAFAAACGGPDKYVAFSGYAQGGTYIVKLNLSTGAGLRAPKPEVIRKGVDSILLEIDNTLSGYNKGSLLSRFNEGETIMENDMLRDIYNRSYELFLKTEGAVDVAAGPLFDAWGFGFTGDSLPDEEKVKELLEGCGMSRLKEEFTGNPYALVKDSSTDKKPAKLNYNCIAQGYSCDLIASYLKGFGIKDMLINVGGEIYCEGSNASGGRWTIGIDKPDEGNMNPGESIEAVFKVPEGGYGVVTSGNYRKFYEKDGHKYTHTIDPRTGYPAERSILSATVVAPDAALADGLATYCMVVGVEEAAAFIEADENLEACLIYSDENGEMKTWTSEGFVLD